MTIGEEIKQGRFANVYQQLALNMIFSTKELESFIKSRLKSEDISMQQFNILRILRGSHPRPLSTQEIRERLLDKMSDTSRIVDRIVLKKWATKNINPKDQRLVEVRITEKGLRLLKKLDQLDTSFVDFFRKLTKSEAGKLNKLLDKIHSK
ncbi:MarR family transcriptional regulator [Niabella terrae]